MSFFDRVFDEGKYYRITRFPVGALFRKLRHTYKTSKIQNLVEGIGFSFWGYRTIVIHKFFIPELIYLLKKFDFQASLINDIIENTWVSDYEKNPPENRVDASLVKSSFNVELKNYQEHFIKDYDRMKNMYQLKGMILSFDQGLGKTLAALATMVALNKTKVIIVAPKSTLHTVWQYHINTFINDRKKVFIIGEDHLNDGYDYYIVNYEAITKLAPILETISKENNGLIVDESHNFLNQSQRTKNVLELSKRMDCKDILLLSGTPLKAVGSEIIPMLYILDNYFDDEAYEIFKKSFGINTGIANDVMHARLSTIMHRKVKENVLKLPAKHEKILKIKMPGGNEYTLDVVKKGAKKFAEERLKFHMKNMSEYIQKFNNVMDFLRTQKTITDNPDYFDHYLRIIEYFKKHRMDVRSKEMVEMAKWANDFEKDVILPLLPSDLKKEFKESRSAVKYVHLKVRGEVIGNYLTKLRMKMTSELVQYAKLDKIINLAMKKTVIFTSFIDTVEIAYKHIKSLGFNALMLHGGTGDDAKSAVQKFVKNPDFNPLVSSLAMLVTGVTLIEANTMVFLNKPYRFTDYLQASDRIHRIGQDTDVYIYTVILDTGKAPNLSTRMEDIMEWSRDQFSDLVGEGE